MVFYIIRHNSIRCNVLVLTFSCLNDYNGSSKVKMFGWDGPPARGGVPETTLRRHGLLSISSTGFTLFGFTIRYYGAIIALGLCGVDDPPTVQRVASQIRGAHDGAIDCAQLLKANAEKGGEKLPFCNSVIAQCVSCVEEILTRQGKL